MTEVTVRQVLDIHELNRQLHGPQSGVTRDMLRRALRVQTMAKRYTHVRTGRLRGSISIATVPQIALGESVIAMAVGTNVRYAAYVNEGVPHRIYPRAGKYLVFKGRRGKMVFARSVAGQHASKFLQRALRSARL